MADDTLQAIAGPVESLATAGRWEAVLAAVVEHFHADSGTIHLLGADGALHLAAATPDIPRAVLDTVATVPVGKGMAGLAVERRQPVNACNIQTDTSGDVRPGARATGLQGSVVVPLLHADGAVGAIGVASRHERTFTEQEELALLEVGRLLARVLASAARVQP